MSRNSTGGMMWYQSRERGWQNCYAPFWGTRAHRASTWENH